MRVNQTYQILNCISTIIRVLLDRISSNSYLQSKEKLTKAERFTAFLPLSSFIISESCFKASMEVFSDSFSLFVDA